jgi:hypothetical protein
MPAAAETAAASKRPRKAFHDNIKCDITFSYCVDSAPASPRDTHGDSENSPRCKARADHTENVNSYESGTGCRPVGRLKNRWTKQAQAVAASEDQSASVGILARSRRLLLRQIAVTAKG